MGSRRVVKYKADVIDSIRSDWTISDDGNDRGPIDGWPAPFLGVDDGSNQASLKTLRRAGSRSGMRFDGYRYGPENPIVNLIPRQVRGAIMFHDGGLNKILRGSPPSKLAQDAFADVRYEDALFSRTGIDGDAYQFLRRQDPGADMTNAPRKGPIYPTSTMATMAGAGELAPSTRTEVRSPTRTEVRSPTRTEAYTLGNFTATVTGGAGAGATNVTIRVPSAGRPRNGRAGAGDLDRDLDFGIVDDAADLQDSIRQWEADALGVMRRTGANLTPAQVARVKTAFYGISQNARTPRAWQATSDAHKVVWQVWNEALRRKPPANEEAAMTAHMNAIGQQVQAGGIVKAIGNVAEDIGKGAFSVVKGAVNVVGGAASIVGKLALSPVRLATDIANGRNVFQSLKDTVKRDLQSAKELAPYAQAVLSVVPGIGQGVNAAIAAGAALAQGQNITDALVAGVKGMVPGGPIAQQALETAYNIAKGQSITDAALGAMRNQVPVGPARTAFDAGVALAHGKNIQDVAKEQGMALVRNVSASLSPKATAPMSNLGPVIGQIQRASMNIVPANIQQVANALLQNPSMRSLPIGEVARRMNVPESVARDAVASVMQAANRTGLGHAVKALAPAPEIARRIGTATTFDQNLARYGSQVAPRSFSPNARPMSVAQAMQQRRRVVLPRLARLMPGGAMGLQDAGAFSTIRQGSTGPDVVAWQKILGVTADGKFGPATDSATRAWQRKKGLVADGIVGPKTWDMATSGGVVTKMSPTPAGPGTMTIPEVTIAVTPPPPMTHAQTNAAASMPTIRLGNSGAAVKTWQGILRRDSGISGFGLPPDGLFGPVTDVATKKWQASSGLTPDGVVGPQSWKKGIASLTTAPLPAESAPGVALPTPVPPGLPPGLPPVPTVSAAPPSPSPAIVLAPPPAPTSPPLLPPPVMAVPTIVLGKAEILKPSPVASTPQPDKAGSAVAALALGTLAAKLFGFF